MASSRYRSDITSISRGQARRPHPLKSSGRVSMVRASTRLACSSVGGGRTLGSAVSDLQSGVLSRNLRMASLTAPVRLPVRRFGETARHDVWWIQPLLVFLGLSTFLVYATWAAFQGDHYTFGPYLSPFYSPEFLGSSPHSWFGPKPASWPVWLPFSPALLILPVPAFFRLTCYYYRGAYYKAFWADPPSCTVGEPRHRYRGENSFPLIFNNIIRYILFI